MTASPKVVVNPTLLRLMEARERLAEGYWIQGAWWDGYHGYCLLGALGQRGPGKWAGEEPKRALKLLVRATVPWYLRWLPATATLSFYNDVRARSKRDVLAVYDRAIEKANR